MANRRSILAILQTANPARAPYGEALGLYLTLAAFDHEVALLFLGDGIFRLLPEQEAHAIGVKDYSRMLGSLADHGIDSVYVLERDATRRGLDVTALLLPVTVLDDAGLRTLLHTRDCILSLC